MTRKKFKIFYPADHIDPTLAGQQYLPVVNSEDMLVMNNQGIFFIYNNTTYYPSIRKLSDTIGNYDVKWSVQ